MTRLLIVPGLHGSGEGHWQTWLEGIHPDAHRVEQDNWDEPCPDAWQARLAAEIQAYPGRLIVAHSLGCIVLARLAVRQPSLPIQGALLVAPPDVERFAGLAALSCFAPLPKTRLPFPSLLIASRNDPYIRFDRAIWLARQWQSDLCDAGWSGHINVASGHGSWPACEGLLSRLAHYASGKPGGGVPHD